MLGEIRGEVRFKEPLSFHTSLRIGGAADIFVVPQDVEDIRHALLFAHREQLPVEVIGGGNNGLVAAVLLARRGLRVRVLEEKEVVGGAVRTEKPFARAPDLAISTGAYLLGLMQPELLKILGVDLPLKRRDPHYFLPTTSGRYLLLGSDPEETRRQYAAFSSEADWHADQAMQAELAQLRDDLAPSWFHEPLSLEDTAERYVRSSLRQVFVDLCRKPIGDYIDRFPFKSDLIRAMYASTDGFTGVYGTWDTPGTGMNFLVHNMCRLPGADGTWMVVEGGMGRVARELERAAVQAGATVITDAPVERIMVRDARVTGVVLAGGREVNAQMILCGTDPFRLQTLVGPGHFPEAFNARIDGFRRTGTTLKVNFAIDRLPVWVKVIGENELTLLNLLGDVGLQVLIGRQLTRRLVALDLHQATDHLPPLRIQVEQGQIGPPEADLVSKLIRVPLQRRV